MEILGFILSLVLTGLIIGALARLVIPGPNPMSIGMTILIGIGGAFIGGIVGALLGLPWLIVVILEIAAAAGIVYFMQRRPVR
ncbi:MAG: hypothetical protein QOD63_1991 [Actinomycetota bacterium]|jgi:uncharacterized membrane protein YeaQ/YmgE (transglycosylase-associated protein family)|nr:hypothetical protein [Actinomycetota bacterium]